MVPKQPNSHAPEKSGTKEDVHGWMMQGYSDKATSSEVSSSIKKSIEMTSSSWCRRVAGDDSHHTQDEVNKTQ